MSKQLLLPFAKCIIADDREKKEIVEILRRKGISVVVRRIGVGDYILPGNVCVERKEFNDFCASIIDGRLFDQASQMVNTYKKNVILVEGRRKFVDINDNCIRGAILSLIFDFGIPVIFSRDYIESAEYLYLLYKRLEKGEGSKATYIVPKKKQAVDPRIAVLTAFPSIGLKSAQKLLKEFGTLYNVFTAPLPTLKKVLGDARGESFWRMLHEK